MSDSQNDSHSVTVHGLGLHCGHEVRVELSHGSADLAQGTHRWFLAQDREPFFVNGIVHSHRLVAERTTLICKGLQTLRTPEHLACALLLWPHSNIDIRILNGELPICDGSGLAWLAALHQLFGDPQHPQFKDCKLRTTYTFGHGFLEVFPNPNQGLDIDASMQRAGLEQRIHVQITTAENLAQILSARTFIFEHELETAQRDGLLAGAQQGCGLLLRVGGEGIEVLEGAPMRTEEEPIRHKVLDLVGDLALLGRDLPKLSIRIHNGGHAVHHHLIERLSSLCH